MDEIVDLAKKEEVINDKEYKVSAGMKSYLEQPPKAAIV